MVSVVVPAYVKIFTPEISHAYDGGDGGGGGGSDNGGGDNGGGNGGDGSQNGGPTGDNGGIGSFGNPGAVDVVTQAWANYFQSVVNSVTQTTSATYDSGSAGGGCCSGSSDSGSSPSVTSSGPGNGGGGGGGGGNGSSGESSSSGSASVTSGTTGGASGGTSGTTSGTIGGATGGTSGNSTSDSSSSSSSGGGATSGVPKPQCSLKISDSIIRPGAPVLLSWDNLRTANIEIFDSDGKLVYTSFGNKVRSPLKGSYTVIPTKSTTYKLVAQYYHKHDDCYASVRLDGDRVSVDRLSLANMPYTGFTAGPLLTAIFYILLGAWGVGVTYYILSRKDGKKIVEKTTDNMAAAVPAIPVQHAVPPQYQAPLYGYPYGMPYGYGAPQAHMSQSVAQSGNMHHIPSVPQTHEVAQETVQYAETPKPFAHSAIPGAPSNLPVSPNLPDFFGGNHGVPMHNVYEEAPKNVAAHEAAPSNAQSVFHDYAVGQHVFVTDEVWTLIEANASNQFAQKALFDALVNEARGRYPIEHGWLTIDSDRAHAILG